MRVYAIDQPGLADPSLREITSGLPLQQVAGPTEHADWGVYVARSPLPSHPLVAAADDAVVRLVARGLRYPPALALAREDVLRAVSPEVTRERLLAAWADALASRLAAARHRDHRLRRALVDFGVDLRCGGRYWVIDPRPASESALVRWVSADYWIYSAQARCFEWAETGQRAAG